MAVDLPMGDVQVLGDPPRVAECAPGGQRLRDIILLAVRYYVRLCAAAERIAGILADRRHRRERTDDPPLGPEVRTSFIR